ncbi:triphosphate tunnel metalloenzyme 3 [Ricinus communis]|uniref:triphosphate tunnel metalloenzyme 3 n=1 Tax=Ricinus communis TaxID=3988 RepID=UPI00201AE3EC|nr:triphosphate tunnel metalloenzyme 3 [Ricinus communis]
MEVEVKLRLPNSQAHENLSKILSPFHTKTLIQENVFFDTTKSQLTSSLAILRLRFYNQDSQCILSLKSKPTISNGISRVGEQEELIDPLIGRMCGAEPWRLRSLEGSTIMRRVREEFGVKENDGFVCLGGFKNVRQVFDWKGLKLEVDESIYDFGTCYEIECESKEPGKDKKLIEELLMDNGIEFCYSEVNKFAVFRSGKLP